VSEPSVKTDEGGNDNPAVGSVTEVYATSVAPDAPLTPSPALVLPDQTEYPQLERTTPWFLAWRALLVDQRAYNTVVNHLSPFKRGFIALLTILGIVVVAKLIGWGLDYLTSPRLESLQTMVQTFIMGLPWYQAQVQQSPQFASEFAQSYGLSWEGVRYALGIPTPANQGVGIGTLVLNTLLAWLTFGTLAHWFARWFGGAGTWRQTLGAMALSYAPLLLLVVEAVPGALVPLSLLFLAMLIGKYLAVKSAHRLPNGYTAASVLLPYLVAAVLLAAVVLFGGALGLEQIPYFDSGVQAFDLFSSLWRQ
jgi:hypothetical protein